MMHLVVWLLLTGAPDGGSASTKPATNAIPITPVKPEKSEKSEKSDDAELLENLELLQHLDESADLELLQELSVDR